MVALTELAMENMHLDTQMISLLYRTHKGLPTPNKISSLYVFDSIARAAHRTKAKKSLVADLHSSTGNAASFLIRLEGMLDGLVEDMLAHGPPEAKEKTRKVLDIWTREGTFSAGALKRLSDRVSGSHANQHPLVTHQGAAQSHTPPTPATPSSAIASLPPAILALLGSAVPTQPPPVPAPQAFTLDPTQLALISQLTAQSQSATPPFSPARNGSSLPTTGLTIQTRPFSPTAPPYSPVRKEVAGGAPSFERSRSQSPTRARQDNGSRYKDQSGDDRARYNDDRRNRRFDDDRSPRPTDPRTRDPRRRSRSPRREALSPGRHVLSPGTRRPPSPGTRKPASPPGRRASSPRGSGRAHLPGAGDSGKDEFGRDLRGGSSERSPVPVPVLAQPPAQPPATPATPVQNQGGLETVDMAVFNPADPACWANLAAAWQVTNGRAPMQEEMMMFVMGGAAAMGGAPAMGGTPSGGDTGSWGQERGRGRGRGRGGFRGRGRGRGRGGFGGGHGGDAYPGAYGGDAYNGGGYGGGSDAVVLGGGEEDTSEQAYGDGPDYNYGGQDVGAYNDTNSASTTSGGGMKKIDGKWVWTKN
ncbi:hypothetical protein RSOL_074910 [Rhizoctonia solani AG-3 Rhs1AP]|uniref:CID domain-containing protein n=1 Tax=Rhizoctonia solani AG-3 Rhs1AP TaxID=1086054 RepID=X8IYS4_9AGAM|nr:hypothetical protein RSOL_074910 [Rhizoctonia solani AG-3 Rhs1AP]